MTVVVILGLTYLIHTYILRKILAEKMKNIIFFRVTFWAIVLCLTAAYFYKEYYGSTTIGSVFERSTKYKVQYMVNLFPDEWGKGKNYRVRADIIADNIETSTSPYADRMGTQDETEGKERVYYIHKAYMINGNVIEFDLNGMNYYQSLEIGKKIGVEDITGKEWMVELTDGKVD